jgi:ABC-type dipeptide/oligopeptide/nickel transport system permease subunit
MRSGGTSHARATWRRFSGDRAALVALAFLVFTAAATLLAPLLPLASPEVIDLARAARAPRLVLGEGRWQNHVSVRFRLEEAPRSREVLARVEHALGALVHDLTGGAPRLTREGSREATRELEFSVLYRPALDPARGSQLEERLQNELASQTREGRLVLRGGGEAEVTLLGVHAQAGYSALSALDRWLVERRFAFFGLYQVGPWLGTDSKGRDMLARCVFGGRVSLLVALAGALVAVTVGVAYGAVAGYLGGRADERMMRLVDVLYALPFLFVVILCITLLNEYRSELAAFGIGRLTAFFVVLGLSTWLSMARVVRGQVLFLKRAEFVLAARVLGASDQRILALHVVPHLAGVVIVYLTLTLPSVMLYESFLSFLGLGVEPPAVSWGLLAADALDGLNPLATAWWLVLGPALFMGATLLALNVLGDGLRDAFDPRLRRNA